MDQQLDPLIFVDSAVDLAALDRYDDAQLDELPFGVVGLDPRGTIVRYNLAEARLARLDRSRVLGRAFFSEIAPCTATPEFQGRFQAFVAGRDARITFPYVFDFTFGAQEVEVELVRSTRPALFYLCINRLKFRPPRPAFADVAAPRQADLVPGEEALGIRRDEVEQRVVVVPVAALRALRLTWDKIAPQGFGLFATEWGVRWGRLAAIDIDAELIETRDTRLHDLPLDDALGIIQAYLEQDGWGQVRVDVTSPAAVARGVALITVERSALAEASGVSDQPRCQLLGGVVRALLSHASGRGLTVREVRCAAQGHPRCEMIATALTRSAELDAALETGGDVRGVLDALGPLRREVTRAGDVLARLF
ncbi:MAG: V4R domain-containing protein [Kofleriaceae bacterium]